MLLLGFVILLSFTSLVESTCTFPVSGDFETSHNGEISFNETHLYYTVSNKGFLSFECHMTSGTKYIVKSEEFQVFNSYLVAVICFDVTTLKSGLYQMGIYTTELKDADYQRVKYIATTTTITDAVACDDNANTDKSVFMEKGTISSLSIQCPDILLGQFSYSFNDTDCLNETGYLNVCTDLTLLSYNYSYCSTIQAYSQNGSLNCLYSTTDGTTTSLYAYNLDTSPDETTYYRFTCFKVMQNGSKVVATQRPKDCLSTQTATSVDSTGATLTMTASVTCVPTTTTAAASVSSAGLIAGLAVGFIILLIILGVIIGYCIYVKKFKKDRVEPRKGLPPTSTGQDDEEMGQFHDEMAVVPEAAVPVTENHPILVTSHAGSPVNAISMDESTPYEHNNPASTGMRREVSFADKIELINKQYPNGRIGSARPAPHFLRSAKRISKTSHGQREVSISSDWQSVSHGILRQSIRSRERNVHDGYSSENEIRQEYEFDINIRVKGKVVSLENLAIDERATTARPTVLKPILKRTASKRRSNRQHTRISGPPAILIIQPFDDLIYLTHDGNGEFAIDTVEMDDDLYESKNRIEMKDDEVESEVKKNTDDDKPKDSDDCLTEIQDIENCEEIDKVSEVETVLPNKDVVVSPMIQDETTKENENNNVSKIEGDMGYQNDPILQQIPIILDSKPPQKANVKKEEKQLTTEKSDPNVENLLHLEDEEGMRTTGNKKLKETASFVETTDNMIQREITVTNIKATSSFTTPRVVNEHDVAYKLKEKDSLLNGDGEDGKVIIRGTRTEKLTSPTPQLSCTGKNDVKGSFDETPSQIFTESTPRDSSENEKSRTCRNKNNSEKGDHTRQKNNLSEQKIENTNDKEIEETKSTRIVDENIEQVCENQKELSPRGTNEIQTEKEPELTQSITDVLSDMNEIGATAEVSRQVPPARTKGSKLYEEDNHMGRQNTVTFRMTPQYSDLQTESLTINKEQNKSKDANNLDSDIKIYKPPQFHSSTHVKDDKEDVHMEREAIPSEKKGMKEISKDFTDELGTTNEDFSKTEELSTKKGDISTEQFSTNMKETKPDTTEMSSNIQSQVKHSEKAKNVSVVKETSFDKTSDSSLNKTASLSIISHRIMPNQEYIRERSKLKKQQGVNLDVSRENSKHEDVSADTNVETNEVKQSMTIVDPDQLQDAKAKDIIKINDFVDENPKGMKILDIDETDVDENLRNIDLADPNSLEKVTTEETNVNFKMSKKNPANGISKSKEVNTERQKVQTETSQGIRTFSQYGMQALVRRKTEDEQLTAKPGKNETKTSVKNDVKKKHDHADVQSPQSKQESNKTENISKEKMAVNDTDPVDLLSGARLITNTMMRSESVAKSLQRAMEYSESKSKDDAQPVIGKQQTNKEVTKETDRKEVQRLDGADKNKPKSSGHSKGKNVKQKNSKSKSDKKKGAASFKRKPKHYQLMTKAAEAKSKSGVNTAAGEIEKDNYDKFGEEEKRLRTSKPNKFRLDNLGVSLNKKSLRKKIKKLKRESSNILNLQSSTYADGSLKKTYVDLSGEYALAKENRSSVNTDNDSDDSDASSVWSVGSMISVRSERLSSRRGRERKRKRKRRKLYRSTSCLSRAVSVGSDSDLSDEEDPLLKVQKRAGSSARPTGSGDIRDLILKIREKSESSIKGTEKSSSSDLHKTTSGDSNTLSAEMKNIQEDNA